jgi:hypothetical protein
MFLDFLRLGVIGMTSGMLLFGNAASAGLNDWLKTIEESVRSEAPAADSAAERLSRPEIAAGLREALEVGVERAINLLGRDGGFLDDAAVRIPMPESLQAVERGLRAVGQGAVADEFLATMNHAAEQAVPETASIFAETIKEMSIEDARQILHGPDDAATDYFRNHNQDRLSAAILPIVRDATSRTGVTSAYKDMLGRVGFLNQFTSPGSLDLDQYVTGKALDGLFLKLAQEERRIRENPVARSSELLKKVFGSAQ